MSGKIFIIILAASILTVLMAGCDSILNKDYAPRIADRHYVINRCGDDWPTTAESESRTFDGGFSKVIVDFDTSNVDQEFETTFYITSSSIPKDKQPIFLGFEFSKIKKDTGKTSGRVRAIYNLKNHCYGHGNYIFDVVIVDTKGRAAVYEGTLQQIESAMFGDDTCVCETQCNECKGDTNRYSLWTRCQCGCPFVGEKCTGI